MFSTLVVFALMYAICMYVQYRQGKARDENWLKANPDFAAMNDRQLDRYIAKNDPYNARKP